MTRRSDLEIYCYDGQPVHLLHIFQSAFFAINFSNDKYDLYEGGSVAEVEQQYTKDQSSWTISLWTTAQKSREVQLKPFNTTCVGVFTMQDFSVKLILLRVSYYRLFVMLAGVVLFFMAPRMGRNTVFHYASGISLGVLGSILVLVYIISRMFPKKAIMYPLIAGGWMVMIYLANVAWENTRYIMMGYRFHLTCYIALSAAISFIACYRLGPVTNERTMNIIQWGLQAVGLTMVLLSSHFQEATVGIAILLLAIYNFPSSWAHRLSLIWRRWFPPKQKLISLTEYEQQGVVETEKALRELRGYCSSPDSNPWKLQLKLSNPTRFAKFMEGESHLNDEELMEYNIIRCRTHEMLTDDDDSDY
ncbi:hypothetical protein B566_EDAN005548 [Ephemera danica]|nr:hypothetical protein B566_EDAN005548 [Ephemera danica]